MLKKIIILCVCIFSFSIINTYGKYYENSIFKSDDQKVQDKLKNISPENIEKILDHFGRKKANGDVLTADHVKAYLLDGKRGLITDCAASLVLNQKPVNKNGGGCVQQAIANVNLGGDKLPKYDGSSSANPAAAGSSAGNCKYDGEGSIIDAMAACVKPHNLVHAGTDVNKELRVEKGLKIKLIEWIKKISGILALGAIFSIAYGSLRLTLSRGEDDQIKKAKDIVKWGIIGFLGIVSAGFLIALVVNVAYSIGGN